MLNSDQNDGTERQLKAEVQKATTTKPFRADKEASMTQTLFPLTDSDFTKILCFYVNSTRHIQIARITNIPSFHFERVIFPKQRLMFEAVPSAQLEVQTCMLGDEIITDRITCSYLCVNEKLVDLNQ